MNGRPWDDDDPTPAIDIGTPLRAEYLRQTEGQLQPPPMPPDPDAEGLIPPGAPVNQRLARLRLQVVILLLRIDELAEAVEDVARSRAEGDR